MKGSIEKVFVAERACLLYRAKDADRIEHAFFTAFGGEEALQGVAEACEKARTESIAMLAFEDADWDAEYSPWQAFGRFSGGADKTLSFLREGAMPFLREKVPTFQKFGVIGYSLGGLFAMYALFSCPEIDLAASVSGSMWYPGFLGYALSKPVPKARVYLSLGKAEEKKHARGMEGNGENAQRIASLFGENGTFEWNNGNHFFEVDRRIARAVEWLTKREEGNP
ncbi:MAG: alpha/beta hydrolase [Christensenellales bacterium]